MWKAYHSVSTIDEALALLKDHGGAARIVAGGTDLIHRDGARSASAAGDAD